MRGPRGTLQFGQPAQAELEERPYDYRVLSSMGQTYALLGNKDEAIRAGQQAVELNPISRDALVGPASIRNLAIIYAGLGEPDKALDLIEQLLSIPCDYSVGLLRLEPTWDPLHDHPRYLEILQKHGTRH